MQRNNSHIFDHPGLYRTQYLEDDSKTLLLTLIRFISRLFFFWGSRLIPYQLVVVDKAIFLIGTPIHLKELTSVFGQQPRTLKTKLNLTTLKLFQLKFQCLWQLLTNGRKIVANARLIPGGYRAANVLSFCYNYLNFHLLMAALFRHLDRHNLHKVGCFELNFIGLAVTEYCQQQQMKSVFIQHGLLDSSLSPVAFDEFYLWNSWDKKFFGQTDESLVPIRLKFINSEKDNPKLQKTNKKMYFALEYPSSLLPKSFIRDYLARMLIEAKRKNWQVILRPHPRDQSDLLRRLPKTVDNTFIIDPCRQQNLVESFQHSNCQVFVTFNSASVLEAKGLGAFCVTIKNPMHRHIVAPFERFTLQVNPQDNLFELLEKFASR